ncbi:MAG: tetraacyldisaccharide 4'-kinase, partial [Prevotella sp.]|nr:tetraacyldisaccharide 4'-kinase [Prevotella sp.]
MEGDFIKINEWLLPFSWLYGIGVGVRNAMFDLGILKSRSFKVPVISVGNITVGGSGKTPHVEYLIRLLSKKSQVAVLSRGYKRKSKGYVLANKDTAMSEIGDEPYQMHRKFDGIYVAVDKDRCHGIERLTSDEETKDTDVILLDDAYQHRYVKPGINILLVDYHRLIIYDKLLPAGRLREPMSGKTRADIVIVTKCPKDLKPMSFRVLTRAMSLFPYQQLYFTCLEYGEITPLFPEGRKGINDIGEGTNVMLLTGIASPEQMEKDLKSRYDSITPLRFSDHHQFDEKDVETINQTFSEMPSPKAIITTEKDSTRLEGLEGLSDEVRKSLYVIPIEVKVMLDQEEKFNDTMTNYVLKNSRNSTLYRNATMKKEEKEQKNPNKPKT